MKIASILSRNSSRSFKSTAKKLLPKSIYNLLSKQVERYYFMSFPKAGRTWLRVLIGKFLMEQFKLGKELDPIEFSNFWRSNSQVPHISVAHGGKVAWQAPEEITLPDYLKHKKIILLVRDPRDILVSLYYHMFSRHKSFAGTLKEFLYQDKGSIDSIIKYYNLYIDNKDKFEDLLIVKYEQLRADTEGEMMRIVNFLKIDNASKDGLRAAIEYASFEKMKDREKNASAASSGFDPLKAVDVNDKNSFKTRKGLVKGFKTEFEEAEIEYLQQKLKTLNPIFGYND
jgi:hypothetical protein